MDKLKNILNDLNQASKLEKIFIIIFSLLSILFSIIDFNHFIFKNSKHILIFDNNQSNNFDLWRNIIICLGAIPSILAIIYLFLQIKGRPTTFLIGVPRSICFCIFSFAYGYVGDAIMFLIDIPVQIYGYFKWKKNVDIRNSQNTSKTIVRVESKLMKWYFYPIGFIIVCLVGTIDFFLVPIISKWILNTYYFEHFIVLRILEATYISLVVVGTIAQLFQYTEQWIIWIIVDIILVVMFSGIENTYLNFNMVTTYTIYTIWEVFGLYEWFVEYKNNQNFNKLNEPDNIEISINQNL